MARRTLATAGRRVPSLALLRSTGVGTRRDPAKRPQAGGGSKTSATDSCSPCSPSPRSSRTTSTSPRTRSWTPSLLGVTSPAVCVCVCESGVCGVVSCCDCVSASSSIREQPPAAVMGVTNFTMLLTILVATILVTVSISYAWSVRLGHVPLAFPYISETGSKSPESCLFGFGMNLASFMYAAAVYLRYRELIAFRAMSPDCRISGVWNRSSLWLGLLSALGLAMVANFQVGRVPVPHFIGAFFCFFGGNVYFALQAWFSSRMCPAVSSRAVVRLRTALTVLSAVALAACIGAALVAIPQFNGTDQVDWRPEHKGYALHVVSTAAEWVVALLFVASIVTYIPEMRVVSVRPPAFRILLLESVTTSKSEKY